MTFRPTPPAPKTATAGPDRLDDARALVAEHAGERHGQVAGDGVQVAVAHAAGAEADEHLAVARVADGQRLDRERLADRVQDGGLGGRHGAPPPGVANNYGGSALRGKGSCGAAPNGSVSRSTLACPGRCHAARVMAAPRLDFGTRGIGPGGRPGTCS